MKGVCMGTKMKYQKRSVVFVDLSSRAKIVMVGVLNEVRRSEHRNTIYLCG
jgi:hypothetical protein